jgi:hypothetical protein
MPPQKAQLDTIELYLKSMVSEQKAEELMEKFKKVDETQAQETIMLFERRMKVQLSDIETILKKSS